MARDLDVVKGRRAHPDQDQALDACAAREFPDVEQGGVEVPLPAQALRVGDDACDFHVLGRWHVDGFVNQHVRALRELDQSFLAPADSSHDDAPSARFEAPGESRQGASAERYRRDGEVVPRRLERIADFDDLDSHSLVCEPQCSIQGILGGPVGFQESFDERSCSGRTEDFDGVIAVLAPAGKEEVVEAECALGHQARQQDPPRLGNRDLCDAQPLGHAAADVDQQQLVPPADAGGGSQALGVLVRASGSHRDHRQFVPVARAQWADEFVHLGGPPDHAGAHPADGEHEGREQQCEESKMHFRRRPRSCFRRRGCGFRDEPGPLARARCVPRLVPCGRDRPGNAGD